MSAVQNFPRLADWQAAAAAGFGVARPDPDPSPFGGLTWSRASGAWPLATVRSESRTRWRRRCRGAGTVGLWFTKGTCGRSAGRSTATRNCARWSRPLCEALEVGRRDDVLAVRDGSVQSLDIGQRS